MKFFTREKKCKLVHGKLQQKCINSGSLRGTAKKVEVTLKFRVNHKSIHLLMLVRRNIISVKESQKYLTKSALPINPFKLVKVACILFRPSSKDENEHSRRAWLANNVHASKQLIFSFQVFSKRFSSKNKFTVLNCKIPSAFVQVWYSKER